MHAEIISVAGLGWLPRRRANTGDSCTDANQGSPEILKDAKRWQDFQQLPGLVPPYWRGWPLHKTKPLSKLSTCRPGSVAIAAHVNNLKPSRSRSNGIPQYQ